MMSPEIQTGAYKFELYIIGDNRRSTLAVENLRGICREHLHGQCKVDVYDVKERPELMSEKKLCVAPTLIKKYPPPEKFLIGDLSDTDKVLEGLNIAHREAKPAGVSAYSVGLRKQGINFKWQHEPSRR